MSSARARRCSTPSAPKAARGSSRKRPRRPISGARSRNWLKVKCIQRQEFVIVGWQDSDKRQRLPLAPPGGARRAQARYAGKVGTGFDTKMIHDLAGADGAARGRRAAGRDPAQRASRLALDQAEAGRRNRLHRVYRATGYCATRASSRCARTSRRGRWCWNSPQKLSKAAKEGRTPAAESFGIKISNPDRVIYPGDNLTKGDLADYYAAIEALMMVDTARRPISLVRCPQGRAKQCFFQKHDSGAMGEHVKHVPIKEKRRRGSGLSLCRGRARDPRLRADGDDRIPRLGQPRRQARIS